MCVVFVNISLMGKNEKKKLQTLACCNTVPLSMARVRARLLPVRCKVSKVLRR